ncbi:hypothetical protein CH296_11110 [Rhodococcus sp. 14-2496-1d]|uniref:hypothetical protein n=1 Tax=Rhodococcus sp. 14-2496-1d TaxID=2023146 RepID=UPI000B9BF359|nr:hypothetical protein [Rhodococcus sp. 14-2496-1d]OZF33177.1 hypothetical protein CH296_11110 [Rhodococcus sp. 14-2496-1d]
MAREYGRIRISIADDEDLEELSADAQWLYFRVLIPDPTMNYAGVCDWRPARLLRKAKDMTMSRLLAAASELERRSYAYFDNDTEEALCRTLIRSDELLKNPKMAAAVLAGYSKTSSRTLRAAVVTEIQTARKEHPDYSSWTHKDTADALSKTLSRTNLETSGYTLQISVPNTNAEMVKNAYPKPVQNTYPDPVRNSNPDHTENRSETPIENGPNPLATSNIQLATSTEGGYVSTEGHLRAKSAPLPSPNCSQHPNGTDRPCRACGDARAYRESLIQVDKLARAEVISSDRRAAAEARAIAIVNCDICDDDGYDGTAVCAHDPNSADRARRGIEAARAAIAKKPEPQQEA